MKFVNALFLLIFLFSGLLYAQEIVLTGDQHSVINYKLEQVIEPFPGIDVLMVSFVIPRNFDSPTYNQKITNTSLDFQPQPKETEQEQDKHGNLVKRFYWDRPSSSVKCSIQLQADNRVELRSISSDAKLPLANLPADLKIFVQPSAQVQSDNPAILSKARELTLNSGTELEAVQAVLHFVVDHMRYILVPEQYDALYAFRTGKGNCQNYSHLAAALLRGVGIPARIVNGITLKKAYDVAVGEYEYSFEMAQGRHSWIEVYFPDTGWIPFDPQQTEFFVSNRYLRIEVGLDNEETIQDGLVRWSQSSGSEKLKPKLEEAIESDFVRDNVQFTSLNRIDGPKKLLLTPKLLKVTPPTIAAVEKPQEKPAPEPEKAPESKDVTKPAPEPAPETPPAPETDYTKLKYEKPFNAGNLEFPKQFDFLYARLMGSENTGTENVLKRNFVVETAEYVTGRDEFAQTFILEEPVLLKKIGVALHNFGGTGLLWLELSEDAGGKPGPAAAVSSKTPTNYIRSPKGYDWVDFDFSREGLVLSPGRYWFTLRYSGSPIVNWFYSYGKPVGPVDGTRSRRNGAAAWDKVLSYEFNFRILGKGAM